MGVHLNKLLVGVLASALRRNIGNRTLQYLQQCLLYTLAGHIPSDGCVFALACDFVDLIHIDDTPLRQLYVKVCRLKQTQEDILHIVASAMAKGTCSTRARVWANKVLPLPVGPIMRMLLFCSSTSSPPP